MIHVIYISSATRNMSEDDLLMLLEECRKNNQQKNITGMLLYREGAFLQVLEGEDKDVEEIYKHISMDERHTGLYLIEKAEIPERNFPNWHMGFKDLTSTKADELEGYADVFDKRTTLEEMANHKDMAVALLSKF